MTDKTSLKPIGSVTGYTARSTQLTPSQTGPSPLQIDRARKAAKKILTSYPDYGKAPPEYGVNLTEFMSHLSEAEVAAVMDPKSGITTRTTFLPTIAEIQQLLKERDYRPAHTTYKRLTEERGPWDEETDWERKARVVQELLGYNPMERKVNAQPRSFEPPTEEDLKNLKLKSPAGGPTRELLAQLEAEGWPFLPNKESAA